MRITYRHKNVKDYWRERWENIPSDKAMENVNVYPLEIFRTIIKEKGLRILEAGCGASENFALLS